MDMSIKGNKSIMIQQNHQTFQQLLDIFTIISFVAETTD